MESERDRKIRERAYELWEQGGRHEGESDQYWLKAEAQFGAGSESPSDDGSTRAILSGKHEPTPDGKAPDQTKSAAKKPSVPKSSSSRVKAKV